MKKIGSLILVLAMAFFFSGCGNKKEETPKAPDNQEKTSTEAAKEKLSKIIAKGDGVKCEISDEMGTYTLWAKAGKVKIEGIDYVGNKEEEENKKGSMLSDGKFVYMWSGMEGTKMSIADDQSAVQNEGEVGDTSGTNVEDWENWAKQKDKVGAKYDCQETNLSDADFTPPSDVVFQDFSELMKNFQTNMPSVDVNNLQNMPVLE